MTSISIRTKQRTRPLRCRSPIREVVAIIKRASPHLSRKKTREEALAWIRRMHRLRSTVMQSALVFDGKDLMLNFDIETIVPCEAPLGEIPMIRPSYGNLAHLCDTKLMQQLTQTVLSTEHLRGLPGPYPTSGVAEDLKRKEHE